MSLQKVEQNATYESLRLAHNETVDAVTTIQSEIEEVKNSSVTPGNLPIAGESLGAVKSGGDVTIEADGTMTVNDNSHNHTVSDILDFPESLPASDVHDWAKAESKPTYTASEVDADPVGSANTALESAKAYTDELANGTVAANTSAIEAINDTESGILAQAKDYVDLHGGGSTNSLSIYGGTMEGPLVAQSNTNYTDAQVRNVTMSTEAAAGGSNGQIHYQFE